jgi:peptidoglycan/LPS O-acetylase OafA/YrhL
VLRLGEIHLVPTGQIRTVFRKRAFRIYPMYWVALFAFVKIGLRSSKLVLQPEGRLRAKRGQIFYSATLLPTHGMPYLDVAWSLQHEIFFYLVAALVPLVGLRGLALLLLASATIACWFNLPEHSLPISHYHADFLAGVMAFLLRKHTSKIPNVLMFSIGGAFFFGRSKPIRSAAFPSPPSYL